MTGKRNVTIAERLEKYSIPEPMSGCTIWLAAIDSRGYGRLSGAYAHRLAFETHTSTPIPDGMHVLHRCDNRACINASHLFLGTQADNMADRDAKGRQQRGGRHYNAKLAPEQVLAIRSASGPHSDIAAQYGVARQTVGKIKRGDLWGHL